MTWFAYTDVKLTVLKNGSPYTKGNFKGFYLDPFVVARVQTDINTSGGNLSTITQAYKWTSGSDNTWEFYKFSELETSDILKTSGITNALENVGDELTFYNEETGPRFALHLKRVAATGVRAFEVTYTFDGVKAAYAGTDFAYDGVDEYGRERRACIGFCKQDYGVYPFVILAVDKGEQTGTLAEVHPWRSTTRADFVNTNQYKYYMIVSDSWTPPPNDDPYHEGGSSTDQLQTGDAPGSFDDTSDTISIPGAPALNLSLNHFISAYVPDLTTLNGLADFIWGNYDKFDSSKKLSKIFADPSDAIISLHMLPFEPSSSTAIEVTIGSYGSSINMPPLTAQFKDISCGTLTIDPYWGNYLDHNPFTRYTLFLPFVGEVQLDPDEIVGETIGVDYRVDCLTGAFVCFVSTSTKILAQYQGNCSLQVPTSSADYSRLNSAILTASTAAVGAAVGVGAAAAGAGTVGAGIAAGAGSAARGLPGLAGNAMNVMQSKVNHSHSGALGGASGFMGSQKPYLIIHRARQSVPDDANKFKGYPCNAKFRLGDLEGCGFTSVKRIKLDGIKLTEGELEELRGILGAGVYL